MRLPPAYETHAPLNGQLRGLPSLSFWYRTNSKGLPAQVYTPPADPEGATATDLAPVAAPVDVDFWRRAAFIAVSAACKASVAWHNTVQARQEATQEKKAVKGTRHGVPRCPFSVYLNESQSN
jgi:hypothetical protein